MTQTRADILAYIQQNGPCTQVSISKAVGIAVSGVSRHISTLIAEGLVRHLPFSTKVEAVTATATTISATVTTTRNPDRLAVFATHINWELSHGYPDGEDQDGCWLVHSVNGGRSDREWTLIGRGETPAAAIDAAIKGDAAQ